MNVVGMLKHHNINNSVLLKYAQILQLNTTGRYIT